MCNYSNLGGKKIHSLPHRKTTRSSKAFCSLIEIRICKAVLREPSSTFLKHIYALLTVHIAVHKMCKLIVLILLYAWPAVLLLIVRSIPTTLFMTIPRRVFIDYNISNINYIGFQKFRIWYGSVKALFCYSRMCNVTREPLKWLFSKYKCDVL